MSSPKQFNKNDKSKYSKQYVSHKTFREGKCTLVPGKEVTTNQVTYSYCRVDYPYGDAEVVQQLRLRLKDVVVSIQEKRDKDKNTKVDKNGEIQYDAVIRIGPNSQKHKSLLESVFKEGKRLIVDYKNESKKGKSTKSTKVQFSYPFFPHDEDLDEEGNITFPENEVLMYAYAREGTVKGPKINTVDGVNTLVPQMKDGKLTTTLQPYKCSDLCGKQMTGHIVLNVQIYTAKGKPSSYKFDVSSFFFKHVINEPNKDHQEDAIYREMSKIENLERLKQDVTKSDIEPIKIQQKHSPKVDIEEEADIIETKPSREQSKQNSSLSLSDDEE